MNKGHWFWIAAGLGIVAGMRSMTAPASLGRELAAREEEASENRVDQFITSSPRLLGALAMSEWFLDKMPGLPDRVEIGGLLVRALSGGASAVAMASRRGTPVGPPLVVGAVGAIAGAYVFMSLRERIAERTDMPDAVVGLAEDVLAITLAARLARSV